MTLTKLACPHCSRPIPPVYWQRVELIRCPGCENEFEQLLFPAQDAARQIDQPAALAAGEANCYFHPQNRAEVACDGCGRYVCAVCRVPFSGRQYCPSCLEARADRRKLPENQRVLYAHIALVLAVVPLLMWPITLITAPTALGFCFYGWKKPGSLLPRRQKLRFIIAGIFATVETGGWIFLLGSWLLR